MASYVAMFYILLFSIATIIATATTPLVIWLYKHFGWDQPAENKLQKFKNTHLGNIPRGGGIVVFLAIALTLTLFVPLDTRLIAILISCTILAIVGFLDDIYDLNPFLRLGTNILVALIIIGAGIGIDFVTNPFADGVIYFDFITIPIEIGVFHLDLSVVAATLALVFIVAMINIVNWSKGVDGQMPGVVALSTIFIGVLSLRFNDPAQSGITSLSFIATG
ncbi:MAG: hypothetical protein LBG64_01825, partial [Pseudomonadales bacterium]|nr:hypothetical protein [Pseudomonadales bacterium]